MPKKSYTLLFVIKSSALNRGMNTGIENLAWELAALGCDVHILSGGGKPFGKTYDAPETVTYHFTGLLGQPRDFIDSFQYLSEQLSFDAVIGWIKNIAPLAHLHQTRRREGRPKFIANQGALSRRLKAGQLFTDLFRRIKIHAGKVIKKEARLYEATRAVIDPRLYYGKIDHVVSISRAVRANVQEMYGFSDDKVSVVHRGVDTSVFAPTPSRKALTEVPVRVLYTGNITAAKGVGDIVSALEHVSTPVHLVLCGNGSKEYVDKLIERLSGSKHRLDWRGALGRADVISEYHAADIFVFYSSREGLGKSLIEAMSCGLAVVVSDIPAFQEVVVNRENGLMVPSGSPVAIAAAIDTYLAEPDLRNQCGCNARQTIVQIFSKWNEINSWMRILHEHTVPHK